MDRMSAESRGSMGFTLIELMTVVAITAITVFVALPAMQNLILSNQVRAQASLLMTSIQLTRSEAIFRNTAVSMCPSQQPSAPAPTCSGTYADGWIIYSNQDRDRVVDVGTDEIIRVYEGLPRGYSLINRAGTIAASEIITYFADGSSRRNRTLMICAPPGSAVPSWSVVMNRVGRPRLAKAWGDCPLS